METCSGRCSLGEGVSSLPAYSFYSFAPRSKTSSPEEGGQGEGSTLEGALYMPGPHVLSDFKISETIEISILMPQRRGWK